MLNSKEREIAIQAIAARAGGSTVQAAEEILRGISALDCPGKPFVVWPKKLTHEEQIEVLESELIKVRHSMKAIADYRAKRDGKCQAGLVECLECQEIQSPAQVSGEPQEGTGNLIALDGATEAGLSPEVHEHHSGASDAYPQE